MELSSFTKLVVGEGVCAEAVILFDMIRPFPFPIKFSPYSFQFLTLESCSDTSEDEVPHLKVTTLDIAVVIIVNSSMISMQMSSYFYSLLIQEIKIVFKAINITFHSQLDSLSVRRITSIGNSASNPYTREKGARPVASFSVVWRDQNTVGSSSSHLPSFSNSCIFLHMPLSVVLLATST